MSADRSLRVDGNDLVVLGQAIRRLRRWRGVSAGELAAVIGVERQRVCDLEAGKLDPPYDLLAAVAEGLGVQPSTLVVYAEGGQVAADAR